MSSIAENLGSYSFILPFISKVSALQRIGIMLLSLRPNARFMLLLFLSIPRINFFIVNLLMLYQTLCTLPIGQTLLPACSHSRFTSVVLISGQIPTLLLLIYHALTFLLVLMSFVQQPLLKCPNLSVNLLILTVILILFLLLC
jgi:hypothetical protein